MKTVTEKSKNNTVNRMPFFAANQKNRFNPPFFSRAAIRPKFLPDISSEQYLQQSDLATGQVSEQDAEQSGNWKTFTCPDYAGDAKLEACLNDQDRLRTGDTGESVAKVQRGLTTNLQENDIVLKDDGIYGPKTGQAVMFFKKKHELGFENYPDTGPGTMSKLNDLCTPVDNGNIPGNKLPSCPLFKYTTTDEVFYAGQSVSSDVVPGATCQQQPVDKKEPPNKTTDCTDAQAPGIKKAIADSLDQLDAAIAKMGTEPPTQDVRDALWLAFNLDDDKTAADVKKSLVKMKTGLASAGIQCEQSGDRFPCNSNSEEKVKGYVWFQWGDIHICMKPWDEDSHEEHIHVLIHESSHRFNGTVDKGYYINCMNSDKDLSPSDKLNNADSYACFVKNILRFSASELSNKSEAYHGNSLSILQMPKGDIDLDSPKARFLIKGAPFDGFFKFSWMLEDRYKTQYPLADEQGNKLNFFKVNQQEALLPGESRNLLKERGVTEGVVHCRVSVPNVGFKEVSFNVAFKSS